MAELKYWLWLSTRAAQRRDALALLDHFGAPDDIYFANDTDYRKVLETGFEPFMDKSMAEPRRILRRCDEENFTVLTLHDSQYPERLKNIFDPPVVLYAKGRLPHMDEEPVIAMVGTRDATPYGVVAAERLGYEIARSGGVIATGLARGIDSAAALGALRAGGRVVGVLGCGLDVVYPRSNGPLFEDVSVTGALISEFPPGTPPLGHNFPIRNRILSGISVGTLLIEAPERSGALITAALALEQGRDVFAVPGNIDAPSCRGSNALLKEGASPALCGWDVMSCYADLFPDKVRPPKDVKLRPLEEEQRERIVASELAEGGRKRPRRLRLRRDTGEKTEETSADATKKVIDNGDGPGYSEMLVDPVSLTPEERTVLDSMKGRMHLDEVILVSGLPAPDVMAALTILEIEGAVSQEPGKYFVPHFKYSTL